MHESLFISGESAWPLHGLNFANCEIAILCHLMLTKTRQPRKLITKNTPVSIQVVKKKTAGVFFFYRREDLHKKTNQQFTGEFQYRRHN